MKAALKRLMNGTATLERLAGAWKSRTSYSQFGEDVHIVSYYDRLAYERGIMVEKGCAVDIGAYRPIQHSNTYGLYKRGWRTINIDPTPGTKLKFDKVRPRDTNLELAIAPEDGRATFYVFGTPSVWNTLDAEAARETAAKLGIRPQLIPIDTARLETILERHLKGNSLELLSIDAEGYDVEILRSNDFAKFAPRLIMIEVLNASLEKLATHPVAEYLAEFDYTLHSWINPNLLFIRRDSMLH